MEEKKIQLDDEKLQGAVGGTFPPELTETIRKLKKIIGSCMEENKKEFPDDPVIEEPVPDGCIMIEE